MKNKKRLLFYQKKFNYLFLNSSIILVCNNNTNILNKINIYLKDEKLLDNVKQITIKRKFFTFYCNSLQKQLNSSNLNLICFNRNVSIDIFSNFLVKMYPYYYYIYFNSIYYNLSLTSSSLSSNTLTLFYNQILFFFIIFLFYLNSYKN